VSADASEVVGRALVPLELERQAITWRRHLHANPELSFQEHDTARFVEETLRSFDGLEIERPTPTSVVAHLRCSTPGKVLALRADMDALPIQEESDVPFKSERPGVMHACGHDAHTAVLLATACALTTRRDRLTGEVRFLFQHAEETPPGGARQLVDAGAVDEVDLIVGIHVMAQDPVGTISVPPGPRTAASDIFAIEVHGRGGHAAMPHQTIDSIAVAAQVVTNLQHIVARQLDPIESAVVSVTRFHAGTTDNVIPEVVELGGTVRGYNQDVLAAVRSSIENIVHRVTQAHNATYRFNYREGYAVLHNDTAAARLVEEAARTELGETAIRTTPPIMGGEDFSAYLEKAPGAFFFVGAGAKDWAPHHHPRFTIDEAAIRAGIAVFVRTALDYLGSDVSSSGDSRP
jgi:amidohydrolase